MPPAVQNAAFDLAVAVAALMARPRPGMFAEAAERGARGRARQKLARGRALAPPRDNTGGERVSTRNVPVLKSNTAALGRIACEPERYRWRMP